MHTVKSTEKNGSVVLTSFPRFAMALNYAQATGGTVDLVNGTDEEVSFEITDCSKVMQAKRRSHISNGLDREFAKLFDSAPPGINLSDVESLNVELEGPVISETDAAPDTIRGLDFSNAAE